MNISMEYLLLMIKKIIIAVIVLENILKKIVEINMGVVLIRNMLNLKKSDKDLLIIIKAHIGAIVIRIGLIIIIIAIIIIKVIQIITITITVEDLIDIKITIQNHLNMEGIMIIIDHQIIIQLLLYINRSLLKMNFRNGTMIVGLKMMKSYWGRFLN